MTSNAGSTPTGVATLTTAEKQSFCFWRRAHGPGAPIFIRITNPRIYFGESFVQIDY